MTFSPVQEWISDYIDKFLLIPAKDIFGEDARVHMQEVEDEILSAQ